MFIVVWMGMGMVFGFEPALRFVNVLQPLEVRQPLRASPAVRRHDRVEPVFVFVFYTYVC